jgi:hypothetical protein
MLAVACVAAATAGPVAALPEHTWVSNTGSDANTGSANSPYADFQTAVADTAPGGEVSVLNPGDYGPVTINNSITIEGNGVGEITFTGSEGVYINGGSAMAVTLRGLHLNGLSSPGNPQGASGVFLGGGAPGAVASLVVENCTIDGCSQLGIGIANGGPTDVLIKDTTCVGGSNGFRSFPGTGPDQCELDHDTFKDNTSAAVLNGNGVLNMSNCTVTQSDIGIEDAANAFVNAMSCRLTDNTTGIDAQPSGVIRITACDIFNNQTGILNGGGTVQSAGNNQKAGNVGGPAGLPPNAAMTPY